MHITECIIPEEMDLILALDISNSLNKREYSVVKNFATRIVNSLNIGNTKTRVGVVKFGFKGSLEFGFTRYYTASSINNAINIMKRQPMKPQFDGTKTAQALNVAVDEFNNNGRQSGKIEWKLIEITDGMATDRVNLPGAIQRLADIGIETYAIGIGDFVKMSSKQGPLARQQLLQVARDPSRVFISPSFDEAVLSDVLQKLQEELGKCSK
jgi:Mg-chelatase subunit ChlD